jgi:hypothetical protein
MDGLVSSEGSEIPNRTESESQQTETNGGAQRVRNSLAECPQCQIGLQVPSKQVCSRTEKEVRPLFSNQDVLD